MKTPSKRGAGSAVVVDSGTHPEQEPTTSSPFFSPAPPMMTSFEGVLSGLDHSDPQECATLSAVMEEKTSAASEDLEESGSSTSSTKRGRARRRKKALYAKVRDQVRESLFTFSIY